MATIDTCRWNNMEGMRLENDVLQVVVLPALGGKTASLRYKPRSFELAAQPGRDYRLPPPGAAFGDYDASGLDDAFPTIDAATLVCGGMTRHYPDHGEIWRSPFDCRASGDELLLTYESRSFGYRYEKRVRLDGDEVVYRYRIANLQEEALPCLWAFHGLVRYEEDMRLDYPAGVETFVNVLDSPQLGPAGSVHPAAGGAYDFGAVPPADTRAMVKYYVRGKVGQGSCGYVYPSQGVACRLTFDAARLPYLGMWITAGGYRGERNCAFEPATGFYDSVATARDNGSLLLLERGRPLEFWLRLRLSEPEAPPPVRAGQAASA